MATEDPETLTVYQVYCRECDWQAPETVELKGVANVLAGRHISDTDHVVALKTVETERVDREEDFHRGGTRSVTFELLRQLSRAGSSEGPVRQCGPVRCVVERG